MRRNVRLAGIDPWLMLAVVGLVCIGVLMVYSASVASSYDTYGTPYFIIQREIAWAVLGLIALAVATRIDYRRWQHVALPFFALTVFMLVVVLMPHVGHVSNGARRWFSLGAGITIEPSELAKLAAVMYMASWLASKGERVRDFQATFAPFSLIAGLIALLIVKQPDLGTTIVVTLTLFSVFYVAGANITHLGGVSAGAVGIAWMLAHSSSYRFQRLSAFVNPWKDPSGVGYHTVQALLALGSGGIFGVGLGNSVEKHALPAPYTDSILAVIGNEWGLMGSTAVLLLYMVIAYRGMRVSVTAPDTFGRLLGAGITSWITFQALLNFAVITSSVPFTGVPLPFISYGGTSLVITMMAFGILLNISRHTAGEGFARGSTDNGRGNRRPRLSRSLDHAVPALPAGSGSRGPIVRVNPAGQRRRRGRSRGE